MNKPAADRTGDEATVWIPMRSLVRHLLAVALLAIAWRSLNLWYYRSHVSDYVLFATLGTAGLLAGILPLLRRGLREVPPSRIAAATGLMLVALPWGEWIGLSFPSSRLDWSRLLFIQYCCLYAFYLLWEASGQFRGWGLRWSNAVEVVAGRNVLWVPPFLYFCFSIWIAFFVYDQIPVVQDSAGHLFQAAIFSRGEWFAPAPPVAESFSFQGDMLIIREGKWFGMYLPGFAFLLAAARKLQAEWVLSPLLGSLTVALWIEYARRWHSRKAALLTGAFCLFSPFLFMMSSTVMIHTPEIFLDSAAIYLARRAGESSAPRYRALLGLTILCAVVVRGFSILVFLAIPLGYAVWKELRSRRYQLPGYLATGLAIGVVVVAIFQWKTTGNPGISGYTLEYDRPLLIGFGDNVAGLAHTPLKGFEQASNNLLGLNHFLTGWHTGALFFVLLFLLMSTRPETWDRLLLGSCCGLVVFYYFYVIQDLVFGPRFLYPMATVLLFFIARTAAGSDSRGQAVLLLATLSIAIFLPTRLPSFLARYSPTGRQAGQLQEELRIHRDEKLLVFLDRHVAQDFVNWNDPFLQDGIKICRDLGGEANRAAVQAFPGHRIVYFRLSSTMNQGKMESGYSFQPEPASNPPGYLSLFEFASAMQSAEGLPVDFFDVTYTDLVKWDDSVDQLRFLQSMGAPRPGEHPHQALFRRGVIHAARLVILPKKAYEERQDQWLAEFDYAAFVSEYESALRSLAESGDAGGPLVEQLKKVGARIDQNQDGIFSQDEIARFLSTKKLLLMLA